MSAVPNSSHLNFLGLTSKSSTPVYPAAEVELGRVVEGIAANGIAPTGTGLSSIETSSVEPSSVEPNPALQSISPAPHPVSPASEAKAIHSPVSNEPMVQPIAKPPVRVAVAAKGSSSKTELSRGDAASSSSPKGNVAKRKLHRIAEVRASQGISERTMCRRLNIDAKQLRAIEDPEADLKLSQLAIIREALEVPFADLLVENDSLSRPVQERAQLLKIMKTAVSLKECKLAPRGARLAEMLCEQLVALMPELAEVGGWPEFGSRRSSDSVARILESEINTSNLRSE